MATTLPFDPAPAPVTWATCPTDVQFQCGTVRVPVDYEHPGGTTIPIAVDRLPAADPAQRLGVLLFNPGGPGVSGVQLLGVVDQLLPTEVLQRFDLIGFDERGTGASDSVMCGTSPAAVASVLPAPDHAGDPLPGTPVFTAMARACGRSGSLVAGHTDSIDTARDMDRIRQALGVEKISFLGLSYGTELGSVYAQMFPSHIRSMVLDGAVDGNELLAEQATDDAPALEEGLLHYFATCEASTVCPLGKNPEAFYRQLAAALSLHPLPAPGGGDDLPVTVGDLDTATAEFLSTPGLVSGYADALVSADYGNGAPLRKVALGMEEDVDGTSLVDAQWSIVCGDAGTRPGPKSAGALAWELNRQYPLFGAYAVTSTLGGCVSWPPALQPVADLHPEKTPPIIVIGNTGDPITPLTWGEKLTALIPSATLVTWEGRGHTWLLNGSSDGCMQDVLTAYLVDGTAPAKGTRCA